MTDTFGPIVTGADVATAAVAHVRTWCATYLAELERMTGRDGTVLPPFRSYVTADEDAWETADQLPGCLVVVPQLATVPERHGDGTYSAAWVMHVAAVVSASDRGSTEELKKLYVAALRAMFLQHPSIGGFAAELSWEDERYADIPFDRSRTLGVGVVTFAVVVDSVVNAYDGPLLPPDDPYADPLPSATVETVVVSTERR